MVEVLEQIPQKSVPQHSAKSTKRASKSAFADFINNLGKTTSAKKNNPSQENTQNLRDGWLLRDARKSYGLARSHLLARNDEVLDSAPKDKILSNILKGKNEEILQTSAPSPLESILSRPRALKTSLNQTPQIVDSAENNNSSLRADSQNLRGNPPIEKSAESQSGLPRSHSLARNDGILDSSPLAQNDKIGKMAKNDKVENQNDKMAKTAENGKVKVLDVDSAILTNQNNSSLRADSQNLRSNPPLENSAESQSGLPRSHSLARNDEILDSSPKAQNDKVGKMAENDKMESAKSAESTLDSANQNNSSLRADSQNLRGNPPLENSAESQSGLPRLASKSRNDETIEKNADSPILARNDEFAPKLGIKNTLKYGAFKAFDALSLLKPSDGKKLSELIKKADELALNLQNIKYTKMGENKGNLGLDSANQNNSSLRADSQNLRGNPPLENSAESQSGLPRSPTLARNDGILDSSPLAQNDKAEKIAQNDKMETQNDKMGKIAENNKVKEVSDSIKTDTTKSNSAESKSTEPKIIDSKSAESPLKNALETENNDIKPINFKNIAESKKETSLDSALNSAKDAIKESKDTGKQAQESAPFANAQGTSKIANQIFDARESMRNFAYALKQEIQNHKPPLSKITIELQPAHLGSVEVSITSQGKNIQIQLNAQQNTLNLFIQNQSDLRTALTQAGYENVAMSFSNGAQMGFSDNSGKWRYESAQKSRNTFSLDKNDENDEVFEIMITNNYA